MNIFHKVALQGLKKSRTRTIVTIIGVILSAAMITAVATFGISLLNYMINGAVAKYGDWHVAFLDVPASFVEEQSNDERAAGTVAFENIGYAALDADKNPDKPYFFIAGYSEEAFRALPVSLLSGRMPENSKEILVSGNVTANSDIRILVGDTLTLTVGNRMDGSKLLWQQDPYVSDGEMFVPKEERTYTVVGICQRPRFFANSAPGYALITKADGADKADSFSLFVKLKNPGGVRSYASGTAGSTDYVLNDDVLRFMGISDNNVFNTLLYAVGGIVVVIIMMGSVFLIHNAFNISLNERTHQFGILLSVGATEKQLRNSVLFEGLCIGAVGIPIGVILGIGGTEMVLSIVEGKFESILYDSVPLTLTVSVPVIAAAAFVSLITILISAYIPARKAAGTPVMECIRQTNEVKVEAKAVETSKIVESIYGLEGTLALKNFKRNKARYRSIVLSLVLSVVLFVSTNAFVIDLKQASEAAVIFTTFNITLTTQDMEDSEMLALYEELKTADGVYESSYQANMTYSCAVNAGELSDECRESMDLNSEDETVDLSMGVQFLEDSAWLNIIKDLGLPEEEYVGQNGKFISIAKIDNHVQRVLEPDQFVDMFTSPAMNFDIVPETNGGQKSEHGQNIGVTFVECVLPDTLPSLEASEPKPYIFQLLVPWSLKAKFEAPDARVDQKGLTFSSKTSAKSVKEMEGMILKKGMTANYALYDLGSMMKENNNMIFIANVFAYTFIILISLIAAANVFNTISTNIKLRRRELAMLRSVGMSERDFQKMMNFECVFYGMRALLVGLPMALLSSWLIYKGMYAGGASDIDFVLPWTSMGISVFSVLFIVFITMLYSISRIKKENIIDALRDDMA